MWLSIWRNTALLVTFEMKESAYRSIILKNSVTTILLKNLSNQSLFPCWGKMVPFKWNINHFSYMTGKRTSMHLTSRGVGMGSRAHDFLAKLMIMLQVSSSAIALKLPNDGECSSMMGAQSRIVHSWNLHLILLIFSKKKLAISFANIDLLMCGGNGTLKLWFNNCFEILKSFPWSELFSWMRFS